MDIRLNSPSVGHFEYDLSIFCCSFQIFFSLTVSLSNSVGVIKSTTFLNGIFRYHPSNPESPNLIPEIFLIS